MRRVGYLVSLGIASSKPHNLRLLDIYLLTRLPGYLPGSTRSSEIGQMIIAGLTMKVNLSRPVCRSDTDLGPSSDMGFDLLVLSGWAYCDNEDLLRS